MGKTRDYREHLLERLKDPKIAEAYLNEALNDEDPNVFLIALKDVADANGGMSKLAQETSLNRESLYKTLSKDCNPKLFSILSILSAVGLSFQVHRH